MHTLGEPTVDLTGPKIMRLTDSQKCRNSTSTLVLLVHERNMHAVHGSLATSLIFILFQISGNPINFLLYISLQQAPILANRAFALHRTGGNQPHSRGEKHKQTIAQTAAQMFNGLFTSVYMDQRKWRRKQLLNLSPVTSLEELCGGIVVLGALDERPRPLHKIVDQHRPGAFFVIVAHVVCNHTAEI